MRCPLALVWTAALAAALPLAGSAQSSAPPRDLKLVGDHWTAWDPPAEIAEGAQVHIIVRGDTLWDLAARFYGDPYLWPQLWERNQYILDAHWIYPGDPLVIGVEVEDATGVLVDEVGEPEGAEDEFDFVDDRGFFDRGRFVQLGTPDDIYCSGYIGEPEEVFPHEVTGSEYDALGPKLTVGATRDVSATFGVVDAVKVGLDTSDIVYLDGGRAAGLSPGDVFVAVEPRTLVRHPDTGRLVGRYYAYRGRVRVLSVQDDSAIGEISFSCAPLWVGSRLKRFEPEPVPSERRRPMRPINEPVPNQALDGAPTIVYAKDGLVSLGQDHVVYFDRGANDGVEPGDVFTVYRRRSDRHPPVILGEVAVLSVQPGSALAKVIESRYTIYIGDLLDPR
ncbi:MAG TPA: LysM peptidoglycan-binding domain-containing protein [Thermoanaerobaculia bacterium]|nr:LysM peptidoglycan-binding domain-containing protein [Thermoanaerobaculia bacterium]